MKRFGRGWGMGGILLLIVLLASWQLIAAPHGSQKAKNSVVLTVRWSENPVEVVLSPGESTTRTVTVTSTRDVGDVVLQASPSIASFFRIVGGGDPLRLDGGRPQTVHLLFSIPTSTVLGTYDGTLRVRKGSQTVPQTLKVLLRVWPKSQQTNNGRMLEFLYPPGWIVSSIASLVSVDNPALSERVVGGCEFQDPPCNAEDAPEVTMRILENTDAVALADFIATYQGGRYLRYEDLKQQIVDGRVALLAHDRVRVPNLAAFVEIPGAIAIVTGTDRADKEFLSLLQALRLP